MFNSNAFILRLIAFFCIGMSGANIYLVLGLIALDMARRIEQI